MTTPTEWPARLVAATGNVMCGRRGPDGDIICRGPIGAVVDGHFYFLPGIVQDMERPGWWRPTNRSRQAIAAGRMPRSRRTRKASDGQDVMISKEPELPARYPCPHCRCIARIESAMLQSRER